MDTFTDATDGDRNGKQSDSSKFTYRSKFDPLTDEEYKLLCDLEEREHS